MSKLELLLTLIFLVAVILYCILVWYTAKKNARAAADIAAIYDRLHRFSKEFEDVYTILSGMDKQLKEYNAENRNEDPAATMGRES